MPEWASGSRVGMLRVLLALAWELEPLVRDKGGEIRDAAGELIARRTAAELCRCGASGNKPFCDSSHERIGFTAK